MRRIIEATTKCPGCKKQIGFLNNYNEENETGECFICKIKLKNVSHQNRKGLTDEYV